MLYLNTIKSFLKNKMINNIKRINMFLKNHMLNNKGVKNNENKINFNMFLKILIITDHYHVIESN